MHYLLHPLMIVCILQPHRPTSAELAFGGYKLHDPSNTTSEVDEIEEILSKKGTITLPPDTGAPMAFHISFSSLLKSKTIMVKQSPSDDPLVSNGAMLVYAEGRIIETYDIGEAGSNKTRKISCELEDIQTNMEKARCISLVSGWKSKKPPTSIIVFQHVVNSRYQAFKSAEDKFIFYMIRENGTDHPESDFDEKVTVDIWYKEGVEYDDSVPLTLEELLSETTSYKTTAVLIGEFTKIVELKENTESKEEEDMLNQALEGYQVIKIQRVENSDPACKDDFVTVGTNRITFAETSKSVFFARNFGEKAFMSPERNCFRISPVVDDVRQLKTDSITPLETHTKYRLETIDAKTRRSLWFAVVLSYEEEFDLGDDNYQFALVDKRVYHLKDLRLAKEFVHQIDARLEKIELFTSTPAIQVKLEPHDAVLLDNRPYWINRRMHHMEYDSLRNYYLVGAHGGPGFDPATVVDTEAGQCVDVHISDDELMGRYLEDENSDDEESDEYALFDTRSPCKYIDLKTKVKHETRNVSKYDKVFLETTDGNPIGVTVNLEPNESFQLHISLVDREEGKCENMDSVVIFLKDDAPTNRNSDIISINYVSLGTMRKRTLTAQNGFTIMIPNGCFHVLIVSFYSDQTDGDLYIVRALVIAVTLIIVSSCFALFWREYKKVKKVHDQNQELVKAWDTVARTNATAGVGGRGRSSTSRETSGSKEKERLSKER